MVCGSKAGHFSRQFKSSQAHVGVCQRILSLRLLSRLLSCTAAEMTRNESLMGFGTSLGTGAASPLAPKNLVPKRGLCSAFAFGHCMPIADFNLGPAWFCMCALVCARLSTWVRVSVFSLVSEVPHTRDPGAEWPQPPPPSPRPPPSPLRQWRHRTARAAFSASRVSDFPFNRRRRRSGRETSITLCPWRRTNEVSPAP